MQFAYDPTALASNMTSLRGPVVTLLVGKNEDRQLIHQTFLCQNSAFFTKALSGEWKEGQERIVRLPCDTPEVVEIYIHWLYFRKIFTGNSAQGFRPLRLASLLRLVKLYVFGDKIQDTNVKDAAIDALATQMKTEREKGTFRGTAVLANKVYRGTQTGSPLRKWLLDFFVSTNTKDPEIDGSEDVEFLADLSRELLKRRHKCRHDYPEPENHERCRYHCHGRDAACYVTSLI